MDTVFSFVILHYKVAPLTIDCIDSLLQLEVPEGMELQVVVVDNASGNGSIEAVQQRFDNAPSVSFICLDDNVGFSRANDKGYRYAVDQLSSKFVIIMNNDTEIRQKDFLQKTVDSYEKHHRPFIIGPDIYVERLNMHQNPFRKDPISKEYAQGALERMMEIDSTGFDVSPKGLAHHKTRIKNWLVGTKAGSSLLEKRKRDKLGLDSWKTEQDNCVLHGAALIFTERFIQTRELPFDPPTFLYEEEELLAIRARYNHWRVLYDPALQVIHFDDGSTDHVTKESNLAKASFIRSNQIESLKILIDYYNSLAD